LPRTPAGRLADSTTAISASIAEPSAALLAWTLQFCWGGRVHRNVAARWALIACLFVPAVALAQFEATFGDAPFELKADSIEYERKRDVYVARGNVRLIQQDKRLSADWISFSRQGNRGVASGSVVYSDGVDTVYANFVEFNLTTLQGVLFLAHFDDAGRSFRMEGEEIVKTGDQTYTFEQGAFTTCRCPEDEREPWQIRASSAELELEGYAVARNTTINILGVPILWLPWMIYPVKTDRESGILFPEFGYRRRNGVMIGLPLFWAAAPNVNVTLTPRWLQKRGIKGEARAEYLLGERSSGELAASYIHDEDIDPNSVQDPFGRDRWMTKGTQDLYLPYDWRLQSEFKATSDNSYPSHFLDLAMFRRDRYLTSNAFLTKHLGDEGAYGFVGSVLIADDIQSPDNQDRDPYMLQRLPDLEFTALPARAPWVEQLVPSLNLEYVYFGQFQNPQEVFPGLTPSGNSIFYDTGIDALPDIQELGFDSVTNPDPHSDDAVTSGPEGDGVFQEGEPLADRGHRMLVNPRIAAPWRMGNYFEVYPEVGWRQSLYQTHEQGFEQWGALTGRVDLRTRLKRSYGTSAIHIMEPNLGYAVIARPDLGGRPLFSPSTDVPQQRIRQLTLDNVTRDTADRLDSFNGITWGVNNRFYIPASGDEGPRLLADISVSAQYNFADGGRLGNFVIDGVSTPTSGTKVRFNLGFDPEDIELDELLVDVSWSDRKRLSVYGSYRYLQQIPRFFEDFRFSDDRFDDFKNNFNRVNQANLGLRYQFTPYWSSRYEIAYAFEQSILLTNRSSVEYLSKCKCWALGLEARQNRQLGFEFNIIYRIVGLGNDPTGFSEGGLDQFGFLDGF
jgi:lipopolysaccharide assembly outer membrane protein LptD (OstA)